MKTDSDKVRASPCYQRAVQLLNDEDRKHRWNKVWIDVARVWDKPGPFMAALGLMLITLWSSSVIGLPGADVLFTVDALFGTVIRVTVVATAAVAIGVVAIGISPYRHRAVFGFIGCLVIGAWCGPGVYFLIVGKWGAACLCAGPALLSLWTQYRWANYFFVSRKSNRGKEDK